MAIREGTGAVPQIADTVYGNGTILTMNPAQPEAEAVAVAGGVIIGVGALSDMKALCGAESRFVDLRGRTMLPGFIDAHTHFDLDVCNTTTADNFDTGTRSALRGGNDIFKERTT